MLVDAHGQPLTQSGFLTPAWMLREGLSLLASRRYREPVVLTDWRGQVMERSSHVGDTVAVRLPGRFLK